MTQKEWSEARRRFWEATYWARAGCDPKAAHEDCEAFSARALHSWEMFFPQPEPGGQPAELRSDSDRLNNPQPSPTANDRTPICELVIEDIRQRDAMGRKTYGTPLQAHNGRDGLVDAYQEALDMAFYLRQVIEERNK